MDATSSLLPFALSVQLKLHIQAEALLSLALCVKHASRLKTVISKDNINILALKN